MGCKFKSRHPTSGRRNAITDLFHLFSACGIGLEQRTKIGIRCLPTPELDLRGVLAAFCTRVIRVFFLVRDGQLSGLATLSDLLLCLVLVALSSSSRRPMHLLPHAAERL